MEEKFNRPPIVCVLGHVDHGKTTLLDAIRKTNVAVREKGGITQRIGASQIKTADGKLITFIDTPGHAAFSAMRSRGAGASDIAILVVAVDDGVQPQTREALDYIKEAKIPFIVAITKIDLASGGAEAVLGQLEKEGVTFEGRGGQTPWVAVSAKENKGITDLLAIISLLWEVSGGKSDLQASLNAVVIETSKAKSGPLVSAVVKDGTLKVGDDIWAGEVSAKVRGLFNYKGEQVKKILPGCPVAILGFAKLPEVGTKIAGRAQGVVQSTSAKVAGGGSRQGQLAIFVKSKNAGSLEAVLAGMPPEVAVLGSGVGDIFESDVLNAKAQGAGIIIAFESKAAGSVIKLAENEGIKILSYDLIYELFDKIAEIIKSAKTEILGKAEIIAKFPFDNKKVAGAKVINGKIAKTDPLILTRKEAEIGKVKIISLKKQKQDITVAAAGEEFGVIFEPQLDFAIGDVILAVK
jgi:translation initiation factor IF-2